RAEPVGEAARRLGVAQEQEAPRRETIRQALEDVPSLRHIEIDEDVATEDELEPLAMRIRLRVEIEAFELDDRAELRRRLHLAFLALRPAEHVRLEISRRDLRRALERPHRLLRALQDAGRNVGGEDVELPARREMREEAHGDRVRLLAARAGRAP